MQGVLAGAAIEGEQQMGVHGWGEWEPCFGPDDHDADRISWALHRVGFDRPPAPGEDEGARAWAFLAEVSRVLGGAPDYEATVGAVGRLAVPLLADYCVVDLVGDDARPARRVVWGDRGTGAQTLLGELCDPPRPTSPAGVLAAVAHGQAIVLTRASEAQLVELVGVVDAPTHRRLGLEACVALPLETDGHVLGALLLASTRAGLRYGDAGLTLAEDFAARAAVAIASARRYREAREADRRKDEVLAMVAHELRTPLGCVLTSLVTLDRLGSSPGSASRVHRTILRQARHLARLVDDLVDVARIRTGVLALRLERVDLREVVRDCLDCHRTAEQHAGHAVTLACAPTPLIVEGDRLRLEQVVGNLLDNAAKYTPPGGAIRLAVEAGDGEAVVSVEDTGRGIARDFLPRVFEPFVRANGDATGGLGLGLALVRSIVEHHRGTVTAHSPGPGQGTLIVVRLPLVASAAA